MKILYRRFPCLGGCGRLIKKRYPRGTFSYQPATNLCRKCAREKRLQKLRLENRKLSLREKMVIAKRIGVIWDKVAVG